MSEPNPGLPDAPPPGPQQPGPQYPVPQQPAPPWSEAPQPGAPWPGTPQPGAPWSGTPWSGGVPPQYGYQVPQSAYPPPGYGSAPYNDPLVTPPGEGYSGWASRVFGIVRRNWQRIIVVSLLMEVVPAILGGTLGGPSRLQIGTVTDAQGVSRPDLGDFPRFFAIMLVLALIGGFLQAIGTGAIVWSVTREAVGQPAPLGESMRYGLRNGPRLFGWSLLYSLLILLGLCACIVGAVYPAVAGALYVPVALYQRGSAIGTSFSMVNKNFWPSLGRMATVFAITYAAQSLFSLPTLLVSHSSLVVADALTVVFSLLVAPVSALLPLGAVVLFAELRARVYPTTSADLAAAL